MNHHSRTIENLRGHFSRIEIEKFNHDTLDFDPHFVDWDVEVEAAVIQGDDNTCHSYARAWQPVREILSRYPLSSLTEVHEFVPLRIDDVDYGKYVVLQGFLNDEPVRWILTY